MTMSASPIAPGKRARIGMVAFAAATALLLSACSGGDDASASGGDAEIAVDESLRELLPQRVIDSGTVVIGGTYDNPPVLFADASDATKPAGVAVDLSVAVGQLLGIEPEWRNTQWAGQLPGLDAGTLDIAWGQATVTEERERELYDMIPFYLAPLAVLVPEGNPEGITSFETMCGMTIGGSIGAVQEYYVGLANEEFCAPQGKPEISYKSYSASEEVALSSGTIDGVIDTFPVLVGAAKTLDGVEAVKLSDADKFDSGLAGVTFSKENPELSTAFSAALQKLWDEGVYQDILAAHEVPDAELERDQLVVNYLTGTPAGEIQ